MINLFVYGTLKKGHRNHHVLGPDARLIGSAIAEGMTMHKGPGFPYAVFKDGKHIVGELYVLPDLVACDRLEGYPHHYLRKLVTVLVEDSFEEKAWIYYAGPRVNLNWYPETTEEWIDE